MSLKNLKNLKKYLGGLRPHHSFAFVWPFCILLHNLQNRMNLCTSEINFGKHPEESLKLKGIAELQDYFDQIYFPLGSGKI